MTESILGTIGNTPLVRLTRALPDCDFRIFAKLEGFNPGGSAKDRPALHILLEAIENGDVRPGTTVIESSSGNLGIGLAQACRCFGLRFICVVDPKITEQNVRILRAYGAEIDVVSTVQPRIDRVKELLHTIKDSFWTNQYANPSSARAHYQTTMDEIATELDGELDYLFVATNTCGTLRGCAEYVRDHELATKIFAVEAHGSAIPESFRPGLADECVLVNDLDRVVGCRRLVWREGILAGESSGGVLMAVDQVKSRIPRGATCAVVLDDRGERYLDTIYSDDWVAEQFGDIAHLWQDHVRAAFPQRPATTLAPWAS